MSPDSIMEERICPYPGLRPFNEEESIFFRGREEHIEKIISQLEEKKFVMLTGASGDGKSSLVYAGVIPNARAGFFKAKFNNWLIADFKPERTPLKNMAIALADKLGYTDVAEVEKELGFGFSSLINLYKNSPYHLDYNSDKWKNTSEADRKVLKRKAANLFLLVDQFEEFFTNSENYNHGKASVASQVVVNLLLETAKIALAEDLPIYIICTMRSDYIGQCAAFRGLPEYIGFSQFFVPRLKRKEIHQVIEEPAMLNGDKIANRLTETLINEIGEGFDQLPVLQHALNQIWNQASKGVEEMNLIHLAKLSGLPKDQLPQEDKNSFESWFETVPTFKKAFFNAPSLENVLNAHANELYETTADYYNKRQDEKITREEAETIIKIAFQCLTKIDNSRAVRNRMSLQEITNIINRPEVTAEKVGKVLDIFRLPGNTLIKPYISIDGKHEKLNPGDVLDITHESLIRNWDLLTEWGKEEHENLLNFLDFNKSLQRWITNDKSKGYLLPIGPLTFFENWYSKCNPNKYWLARYDESDAPEEEKLRKAEETLINAQEFIKQSAAKLFFTRTVMKYGANRLLTYLGILVFIITCTYYYFDYQKKQNSSVIRDISAQGIGMLKSNKIDPEVKARFLINYERLNPGSWNNILDSLKNDSLAYDIGYSMFTELQNYDDYYKQKINPLCLPILKYLNNNKTLDIDTVTFSGIESKLDRNNQLITTLCYVLSHEPNPLVYDMRRKHLKNVRQIMHHIIEKKILFSNIHQFNYGIELLLGLSQNTDEALYLASKISPFDEGTEAAFTFFYPKEKTYTAPATFATFTHNGGYQFMAYVYSSLKDTINTLKCIDSVVKYNTGYKNYYGENFCTVLEYAFISGGFTPGFISEALLKKYEQVSGESKLNIIGQIIANNTNVVSPLQYFSNKGGANLITYLIPDYYKDMIFDYYLKLINTQNAGKSGVSYQILSDENGNPVKVKNSGKASGILTQDELNFKLAMYYKKFALYESIKSKNRSTKIKTYLYKAFEMYSKVSDEYLNNDFISASDPNAVLFGQTPEPIKNSVLFLYPKVIDERSHSYNLIGYSFPFMDFLIENPQYHKLCLSKEVLDAFNKFMYSYLETHWNVPIIERDSLNYNYISFIKLTSESLSGYLDKNTKTLYDLIATIELFKKNDLLGAMKAYKALDFSVLLSPDFQKNQFQERANVHNALLKLLAEYLAINNNLDESFKVAKALVDKKNLRSTYMDIAYNLQEKGPIENTFIYLDSLYASIDQDQKMGMKLFRVLGMIGGGDIYQLATFQMKDIPEPLKPRALQNFIRGISYSGQYYKALTNFPEYISSSAEMDLWGEIMNAEANKIFLQDLKYSQHDLDAPQADLSKEGNLKRVLLTSGWESYIKNNYSDDYGGDHFGDYEQ